MIKSIQHNGLPSGALNGLHKAMKEVENSTKKLSRGEVSADAVAQLKLSGQNVRLQTLNLKSALESEKRIIDLLA